VIVSALLKTLTEVLNLLLLLVLLMYVFAIVGYNFFGTEPSSEAQWGDLLNGMYALFQLVTVHATSGLIMNAAFADRETTGRQLGRSTGTFGSNLAIHQILHGCIHFHWQRGVHQSVYRHRDPGKHA
jgi:hypothetical protein